MRIPHGAEMGTSEVDRTEGLVALAIPVIDQIVKFLRARHGLSIEEAEDFGSQLKIKLLDNDRSVLRAYRGDSSLRTYLGAVAARLFLDHRISQWGKWRPSAQARRLGPLAVELEELVGRQGRTRVEAIDRVAMKHAKETTRADVERLAEELRLDPPVRKGDAPLSSMTSGPSTDAGESALSRLSREELGGKLGSVLQSALADLSLEDRAIVKMHFQEGLTLAAVARALGLEQKLLYRRVQVLLESLRGRVEAAGIHRPDVADLLGRSDVDLSLRFETLDSPETGESRPSNPGEP